MPVYRITEYGKIISNIDSLKTDVSKYQLILPYETFSNLWDFILEKQNNEKSIEKAFSIYTSKGKRIIQAKNHVGVIETRNGDVLEILPKIWNNNGEYLNLTESKKMFLKMLSKMKNSPFINIQDASIDAKNDFPILEQFISAYLNEVEKIVLYGINSDYIYVERNSNFIKGKILFNRNLKTNITNKAKFFLRHSSYDVNIPQNKIIVSTIKKLKTLSTNVQNQERISRISSLLFKIQESNNIIEDIEKSRCRSRLFKPYENLLSWSEIFLLNRGFTSFSGDNINKALLFPMEKIFESYVAYLFKKHSLSFHVSSQNFKFYLVSKHRNRGKFKLVPDIFAEQINEEPQCIVVDTKWKIIDEGLPNKNYLISQSDIYQLYGYGKKYTKNGKEPKLFLIYPKTDKFLKALDTFFYEETDGQPHLELKAIPFDLCGDYQKQIHSILYSFEQV